MAKLTLSNRTRRKQNIAGRERNDVLVRDLRKTQTYTAVIHREQPWYVAECAELGVASQGKSIEEALANLKEATELYLEEFPSPTSGRALITTFEVKRA